MRSATAPETGARVKRPARVQMVVSTGPPKRPVPTLRGLDANAAADALRDAGFVTSIDERPSTTVEPGSLSRCGRAPARASRSARP